MSALAATRDDPTSGLGTRCATPNRVARLRLSSPGRNVQELARARDHNVAESPSLSRCWSPVTIVSARAARAHSRIRLSGSSSRTDVDRLPGVDHDRELPNRLHSLTDPRSRPAELPDEDRFDLLQDRE